MPYVGPGSLRLGFPGGWVGVGSHLIHLLHPSSRTRTCKRRRVGRPGDPYKPKSVPITSGEDYDCGMQVHGPAHYDRLEEVAFDLLDDNEGQYHIDGREGSRSGPGARAGRSR